LDRLPRSDAIYTSFADAVGSSRAIIADITDLNRNVMYEIGFAHGRGLKPLIFTSDRATTCQRLPVYFKTLNVRVVSPETSLASLVEEYLRSYQSPWGVIVDLTAGILVGNPFQQIAGLAIQLPA
jgi:hypothetical protein